MKFFVESDFVIFAFFTRWTSVIDIQRIRVTELFKIVDNQTNAI